MTCRRCPYNSVPSLELSIGSGLIQKCRRVVRKVRDEIALDRTNRRDMGEEGLCVPRVLARQRARLIHSEGWT